MVKVNEEKLQVEIKSEVEKRLPLTFLNPLQGNLKDLPPESAEALTNSILTKGFMYPFFVWENPEDAQIYIIDGHQRYKVLNSLKSRGYAIPQLPVIFIHADTLEEAKENLAAAASQYGKFTEEGVKEFFGSFELPPINFFDIPFFSPTTDVIDLSSKETVTVSEHERTINDYKEAPLPDLANADAPDFKQMTFIVHIDQLREIEKAISKAKNNEKFDDEKNENSNGNSLYFIAKRYNEKIG